MMNTMEQNNLKNLLENLTEQPSQGCWSNIESQLNVIFPNTATQPTIQGGGSAVSKSSSFLSKIAAAPFKAAAITGSVALVSAVSIIAIHSLNKKHESPVQLSQSNQNPTTLVSQDTLIEKQDVYKLSETAPVQKNEIKEESTPTSYTAIVQNTTSQPTQNTVTVNPVNNPVLPSPVNVIDKPTPNPKPAVTNVSHTQDPVLENQEIPVSTPVKITIPNIFTPNGDGYNDFFEIGGIDNCTEHMLIIKNSSGKTIFQSSDYQNDWNAENCPDGVYIYYFVYKVNKIEEKMMGKVIIKR